MNSALGGRLIGALAAIAITFVAVAAVAPAGASAPPSPWDGKNPFQCTIQNAGRGTTVPDPNADPYCVSFDKTGQNVTELGLVQFLSLEPARVAAATPKCFYFQEDHWRGSLIQSDASTVIYEFYGHYFFNKATGDGGAWVTGFSVGGQTFDPASLPGFPPSYGQYFGPGTGGFISHDEVPVDPACAAKATPKTYAGPAPPRCIAGGGRIGRRGVGSLRLGAGERRVRAALGAPQAVKRGFLRYCVTPRGTLLVGEPTDRSGTFGSTGNARTVMLLTSARGFVLGRRVAIGRRARMLGRRWHMVGHVGGTKWLRSGDLLAGISRGRITTLGVYQRRAIRRRSSLLGYLRRSR